MEKYIYFIAGIIFGIAVSVYLFISREEKIEKTIINDQKIYSTEKLNDTMENVVKAIDNNISELKRELTEDEKNEIIVKCYKEKFEI